jgi:hypothetical protein
MSTYKNFLFTVFLLWTFGGTAQVISNFNDTTTQGWLQEGDGSVNWSADGFPGGALRINDDASGDINYAIAPSVFLGDWSAATSSDTLKCNVYYDQLGGTVFAETTFFYQISGPGGQAQAIVPNPIPVELTWETRIVSLDESDWMLISGDWNALFDQVTEV